MKNTTIIFICFVVLIGALLLIFNKKEDMKTDNNVVNTSLGEKHIISVDYSKDFVGLTKNYINDLSKIDLSKFQPKQTDKKELTMGILKFKDLTSESVLKPEDLSAKLKTMGYRPATAMELVTFMNQYPDVIKTYKKPVDNSYNKIYAVGDFVSAKSGDYTFNYNFGFWYMSAGTRYTNMIGDKGVYEGERRELSVITNDNYFEDDDFAVVGL